MNTYNRDRLLLEIKAMKHELPQFIFYQNSGEIYFEGWQTTLFQNKKFKLKLVLPNGYPDQMPNLYVTEPVTLHKHSDVKENKIYPGINLLSIDKSSVPSSPNNEFLQNATINSDKTSHEFHTYGNGPNGCVQICHTQKQKWDASKTCVGVFIKGLLWVTAYTVHLETGDSIANVLESWGKA